MSEQKYYVKDLLTKSHMDKYADYFLAKQLNKDDEYEFVNHKELGYQFTKLELAKIMDGALYRGHEKNMYCVFLGCEEWINPLIELVPVEEE